MEESGSNTESEPAPGTAIYEWTEEDEQIYQDSLHIVDKLHWEPYRQKDELELTHHLLYHQGENIIEPERMIRLALDSAQAAKGSVVQVLSEMTAQERGNSPVRIATDSRRETTRSSGGASSSGPMRMRPSSKRALRQQIMGEQPPVIAEPVEITEDTTIHDDDDVPPTTASLPTPGPEEENEEM